MKTDTKIVGGDYSVINQDLNLWLQACSEELRGRDTYCIALVEGADHMLLTIVGSDQYRIDRSVMWFDVGVDIMEVKYTCKFNKWEG